MLAPQDHWSPTEWKHDDEKRFQRTLGLSVLLHALLLLAWKPPPQIWKAADHAVLTVVLRGVAPLAQSSPAAVAQKQDVAVLVQQQPAPATFSVPPKPAASGTSAPSATRPQSTPAASPARVVAKPTPGRLSNAPPAAIGVTVLLVIDGNGRVGQIFWDKLPALTDDQFRRLEAVIREKTYTAGQTLNEIVDVRAILQLPPAQAQESAMPLPQPTAE
jgi:hypothetical protein